MPERIRKDKETGSTSSESKQKGHEEVPQKAASSEVDAEALKEELDELLDEIDAVLEENAESFVKNYIQKGANKSTTTRGQSVLC